LLLSFAVAALLTSWPQQHWPWLLVPLVLFIRMALNAIDGMLAREHAMKTRLGALLNELADVLSDAALYLPFALIAGINAPLVVVAVVLAVISEMAGVLALQVGAERRYDGPMGKSDRAFVFSVLALARALVLVASLWLNIFLMAVVLLLLVTIFNRCRRALEQRAGG
jgi:CDP-diacylglycerol--glycerol-3-phosphate 3-phosphatidyltransferase